MIIFILTPIYAYATPSEKRVAIIEILEQGESIHYQLADLMLYTAILDLEKNHPEATTLEKTQYKEIMFKAIQMTLNENPLDISPIIESYEKYFTETEINAIVAFYRSPAGIKFKNVYPAIIKDSITYNTEWSNKLKPLLMKNINKVLQENKYR